MSGSYHDEILNKYTLRLREQMSELPMFLRVFFLDIADSTSIRTRVGYAYDLKLFFEFLSKETLKFDKPATAFEVSDLERVTWEDLAEFMEYLNYYLKGDAEDAQVVTNKERGKSRKLSAVRTMFSYFYRQKKLASNPAELVSMPKLPQKAITRLEYDEVAKLLDTVESGDGLTEHQRRYHEYTKVRDLAIISLLLGTGLRVSECVGIDLNDVSFEEGCVRITRKGADEAIVYFGDEVFEALEAYMIKRDNIIPLAGSENALFLSMQRRRISDQAIQRLVKKYARLITALKDISPHKLRSTYGTNLYRETGDIYLVADVLGHKNVETTRKYYAEMSEDNRRKAARIIKLRRDGEG